MSFFCSPAFSIFFGFKSTKLALPDVTVPTPVKDTTPTPEPSTVADSPEVKADDVAPEACEAVSPELEGAEIALLESSSKLCNIPVRPENFAAVAVVCLMYLANQEYFNSTFSRFTY